MTKRTEAETMTTQKRCSATLGRQADDAHYLAAACSLAKSLHGLETDIALGRH
jgi:hypothetical protein